MKYVDDISLDSYGLNLMSYLGTTDSALATSKYFRLLFGKWALVSVSYFSDSTVNRFFPPMLRFEINTEYFPLVKTFNSDISFKEITLNQEMYALVREITIYHKYIAGVSYYQRNSIVRVDIRLDGKSSSS